ncbi:MAG: NUDIX hydrolase [Planctomycetales bacterium]|nr:NUDIX hydrolase [Planctomycetales bacterium]
MTQHGPWKIHLSKIAYSDPWISVQRDEVTRPDGQIGSYATIDLKSGVCVVAVDRSHDKWSLHLTSEFHYAVGRVTIEGVSGGIEPNETPLDCAKRELREELGLQATKWTYLGRCDPFTASVRSTVDMFMAEDLCSGEVSPDGTEQIELVTMELKEALDAIRESKITHAPTCLAILRIALDFAPRQATF